MPTPVQIVPSGELLRRLATRRQVSGTHGLEWAQNMNWLRAYNVQPIYSGTLPDQSAVTGTTFNIMYARTPGVQIVAVVAEVAASTAGDSITAGLSLTGATLLSGSGVGGQTLDGTTHILCPDGLHRNNEQLIALLDVTGVTAGTIQDLALTWASVTGGKGLYRATVIETPLGIIDPAGAPTTEPGVNAAWPNPPNRLYDGSSSTGDGLVRLWTELDNFRTGNCTHRNFLVTGEDKLLAATTSSTSFGSLGWPTTALVTPKFIARARRFYDSATAEPVTFRIRYTTDSATVGGTVRLAVTNSGGTTTNYDITVGASGVGLWKVASMTAALPCSGTGICTYTLDAHTSAAGQLWISQAALKSAWS